jgi:hypothetical protein
MPPVDMNRSLDKEGKMFHEVFLKKWKRAKKAILF